MSRRREGCIEATGQFYTFQLYVGARNDLLSCHFDANLRARNLCYIYFFLKRFLTAFGMIDEKLDGCVSRGRSDISKPPVISLGSAEIPASENHLTTYCVFILGVRVMKSRDKASTKATT